MVNFKPTEDQELLRETMKSFAREVIRPGAREADEQNAIPSELPAKGWELGLVQNSIPEEHGGFGSGRSAIRASLKIEELAYGDLAMALHLLTPRLFTIPLIVAGTDQQKAAWLPMFAGDSPVVGTAAFTEPAWDFDPQELSTTATPDGGNYVLAGRKCLVPLANQAKAILVYASAPDGLAAFIVEPGAAGLSISEREKNMGVKALDTFGVELAGVRVPASARLGGEGADVQPLIDAGRVANASMAVGVAHAAFDYACEYAKERQAFGVPIGQKQAIAFMLADMATEIDSTRLLAWQAAWCIDQGQPATREACLASRYATKASLEVADDALQVLGGHGYIRDHPVELYLRNARGIATFDAMAIV